MLTMQERVTKVKAAINADIAAGIIPPEVRTFSELHDHVDANEYLAEAIPDIELKLAEEDETGELSNSLFVNTANELSNIIDAWLKAERRE